MTYTPTSTLGPRIRSQAAQIYYDGKLAPATVREPPLQCALHGNAAAAAGRLYCSPAIDVANEALAGMFNRTLATGKETRPLACLGTLVAIYDRSH